MKQVVPKNIRVKGKKVKKTEKKKKQEYGTSQLERDFAHDFLEANGLSYIYQYEATDIKRFYDFALVCDGVKTYKKEKKDGLESIVQHGQGIVPDLLIEIDGSYFHSDPRVIKEDKLTPLQKHNKFVDSLKDKWAGMHCIPLLRIWEYDIRKNPKKVLDTLSKYVKISKEKREKINKRKQPH
jgi:hypothetical protein